MMDDFELTVPEDYDPATYIASFKKKYGKDFFEFRDDDMDAKLAKVSSLTPGKTYIVGIIQTAGGNTEGYLALLKRLNAVLVGTHGALLVWQLKKEKLGDGMAILSFDQNNPGELARVWKSDEGWYFETMPPLQEAWYNPSQRLLCFCEK